LSEGGLAVAIAEMSFDGELGADINLAAQTSVFGIDDPATLLFSESNTRFLVEVASGCESQFSALAQRIGGAHSRLCIEAGAVAEHDRIRMTAGPGAPLIATPWSELKSAWQTPLIH
jgi:phosphoribosylformylglycinamidine synthase